ncbi:MAG: lyase domain protein repeat-containing protein, partial [Pedosphaera sp.]|nr:lyase domain protein repeat-containing protein [Pedosphaera sp.]
EAVQAIRAMGTNAVPYLIAVLEKDEVSRFDRLMGRSAMQLLDRHREAALALDALGPECKPWIPELNRILHGSGSQKEAAVALAAIGPEGWEVLTRATAENGEMVTCCLWALGSHRAAVPGTVDALLASYARNKPFSVDILSLWALEEIKPDQEQLIPLLLTGLKSDRQDLKWGSAVVLGRLGRKASSAVPALMELLNDRNPLVRHDAAQALEQIDPQAAARAGVTGALASEHIPKTSIF